MLYAKSSNVFMQVQDIRLIHRDLSLLIFNAMSPPSPRPLFPISRTAKIESLSPRGVDAMGQN